MLKSNIEKLGIQFIDAHYEIRAYNSVEDEKQIYNKIVNKYKETNCTFNEAALCRSSDAPATAGPAQ